MRDHLLPEQFLLAIEAMTMRLQQLHPDIPCKTGCFRCCQQDARPNISPAEWDLIQRALLDLTHAQLLIIANETQEQGKSLPENSTACPLLIEGRCSVYAMRPLACRLTGYSFSQAGERPLPQRQQVPRGTPIPFSCHSEQERMLGDLQRQEKPLQYMFLPQIEKLQAVLCALDANPEHSPQLLLSYLQKHFSLPVTPD